MKYLYYKVLYFSKNALAPTANVGSLLEAFKIQMPCLEQAIPDTTAISSCLHAARPLHELGWGVF